MLSIFLLYGVGKEINSMLKLKKQKQLVEVEVKKLEEENVSLISQKNKLEDPNYVQTYARGNYMFTKEGEQVFYLPSTNQESEVKNEN